MASQPAQELPLLQGAQTPASIAVRGRDVLSSQRFRSVSAIYKDTDAGHGDRAEPSRGTEPRRTAAARPAATRSVRWSPSTVTAIE